MLAVSSTWKDLCIWKGQVKETSLCNTQSYTEIKHTSLYLCIPIYSRGQSKMRKTRFEIFHNINKTRATIFCVRSGPSDPRTIDFFPLPNLGQMPSHIVSDSGRNKDISERGGGAVSFQEGLEARS